MKAKRGLTDVEDGHGIGNGAADHHHGRQLGPKLS